MVTAKAVQTLRLHALKDMVSELLSDVEDCTVVITHDGPAVEARNLAVLPTARQAREASQKQALRITTAEIVDPDRLDRLMQVARDELHVAVIVHDIDWLLDQLATNNDVRARYFPERDDLAQLAEQGHASSHAVDLVLLAAERSQELEDRRIRLLGQVVGLFVVLVVPWHLSPAAALITGVVGLMAYGGIGLIGVYLRHTSRKAPTPPKLSTADALLPTLSAHEVSRLFTLDAIGGLGAALYALGLYLVALLRLFVAWGLFAVVAMFAFVYSIVWGLDPTTCSRQTCEGAFTVLTDPRIGDFFFISVQAAFFNVAGGYVPTSISSRAVVAMQFVASALFLSYFSEFHGLQHVLFPKREEGRKE